MQKVPAILHPPISYTDEGLLELATERITLWQEKEVALLRNIKNNSNRQRQRDISGDIRIFLAAACASINLKQSYKVPPKAPNIPLLPLWGWLAR